MGENTEVGMPDARSRRLVGLPARPFLYTLDQIQTLVHLSDHQIGTAVFKEGHDVGKSPRDKMLARNIGDEKQPDWRVAEREFIRWMRRKGFRVYERTFTKR